MQVDRKDDVPEATAGPVSSKQCCEEHPQYKQKF